MQKFELYLVKPKQKSYQLINWLLISANLLALLFLRFSNFPKTEIPTYIEVIEFLIFVYCIFLLPKKKTIVFMSFVLAVIYWNRFGFIGLGLLNSFFLLASTIANRDLKSTFLPDKIIYPSFPKKNILWEEVSNVILKDGILTIDFKNNKLFQAEVLDNNLKTTTDEINFNEFCKEQLNKGGS